jgi:putrescine transport system substrate-binding protein
MAGAKICARSCAALAARSSAPMSLPRHLRAVLAALTLCLAMLVGNAKAEPRFLNILGWGDYFDPRALDEFTAATGVGIVYDAYSSREALEARLRAATDYDVLVVPGPALRTLIAAGALQKLDRSKLGNAGNLWPEIMARLAVFDPGNQYAAPYLWSTEGFAFDVDQAKAKLGQDPPDSLDILFRPDRLAAFADCGVSVPDSPEDLFALALRDLRLDPGSKNPADLRRAAELLGGVRRHAKKFNSADYAGALANGDICLALGWSGDSLQARARAREAGNGVDIAYAIPKEGTLISIDALAIPKNAPHGEAALAFINFLLRPEIAARNTNATKFANAVPASKPLIAKDIAENKSIYPDAAVMDRLFAAPNLDPATQKFISREWSRIKTGK